MNCYTGFKLFLSNCQIFKKNTYLERLCCKRSFFPWMSSKVRESTPNSARYSESSARFFLYVLLLPRRDATYLLKSSPRNTVSPAKDWTCWRFSLISSSVADNSFRASFNFSAVDSFLRAMMAAWKIKFAKMLCSFNQSYYQGKIKINFQNYRFFFEALNATSIFLILQL